jgi:hypothetical protein
MSDFKITPQDVGRKAISRSGEIGVIGHGRPFSQFHEYTFNGFSVGKNGQIYSTGEQAPHDAIEWADEPATATHAEHEPRPKDLRDEFAMVALQGILSNSDWMIENKKWQHGYAEHAYEIADAMMKAREVKP